MIIEKKIFHSLENIKQKCLIVACSGGADSTCLALISKKYADLHNLEFRAVIVDHNLREESSAEALWVKSNLKKYGIDSEILKWQHNGVDSNIHKRARDARYTLIAEYCKRHNVGSVLVAHNKQDQAETVMIRILRGTGIDGLSAMKFKSKLKGVVIYRPMLDISREEIEAYLNSRSISYVNDPSNKDEKYTRVKVRNLLKQINDEFELNIYSRLVLLSENAGNSSSYIGKQVKDIYKKSIYNTGYGVYLLDLNYFKSLHLELKFRLIRSLVEKIGSKEYSPRLANLKMFIEKIENESLNCMLSGVRVSFKSGKAIFFQEDNSRTKLVLKPNETVKFAGVKIKNIFNHDIFVGILGEKGWLQLKKNGVNKPQNLSVEIIKSTVAIFDINNNLILSLFEKANQN